MFRVVAGLILTGLLGCQVRTPTPMVLSAVSSSATPSAMPVAAETSTATVTLPPLPTKAAPTQTAASADSPVQAVTSRAEPAGCLSAAEQAKHTSPEQMLAYADSLLSWAHPLGTRRLNHIWNAVTQTWDTRAQAGAINLDVGDVKNLNQLQDALNALHVAGFVAWLRTDPAVYGAEYGAENHGRRLLAIPLTSPDILTSPWGAYIKAYWQSRDSVPADPEVIPALKLPPCAWMVEQGFAPHVGAEWWPPERVARPNYVRAAQSYEAETTEAAYQSAGRIDWLGPLGKEGPQSMCGPLVWAIQRDAGAFPPGFGNWSVGPTAYWLSNPRKNGRPWTLFPEDRYQVEAFRTPMGEFDFSTYPLYPGDFLFSYSKVDGFDHMFMVTEIDASGNVFTVTNLIRTVPVEKMTVERTILYNINDSSVGIIRNEWRVDRKNGRTGHNGFDVFRWAWMAKDISGQAAKITVQPGDTFDLLAEQWRTPASQIAQYNGKQATDTLTVGETILIPPVPFW